MRLLVIGNFTDRRCGIQNYCAQATVALARAGHQVDRWDGTYSAVYGRQQENAPFLGMFPPSVCDYDVVHTIWHAMTLNHYAGAPWVAVHGPLISYLDAGPSDTYCPFRATQQVWFAHYPREGFHVTPLPIVDWVETLPAPDPVFTVGATSIRGDGIAELRQVCEQAGWALNLPVPGQWTSIEDEVRRLARSTVNVCWYNTPPNWRDMAGAPSTALASKRPLLISHDSLLWHLWDYPDLYHGTVGVQDERPSTLLWDLLCVERDWKAGTLRYPQQVLDDFSWSRSAADFTRVWEEARRGR